MLEDLIPPHVGAVRGPLAPKREPVSVLAPALNPYLADALKVSEPTPQPAHPKPVMAPAASIVLSPKAQARAQQRAKWHRFRDATVTKLIHAGLDEDQALQQTTYMWAKRSHDEPA